MFNKLINIIQTYKDRLNKLKITADEIKASELNLRDEVEQVDLSNEIKMEEIRVAKQLNGFDAEYLLVNFPYINGSDIIAPFFCREYQMQADEKFDGIWFSIIKVHDDTTENELWWHEDWGNSIKVRRDKKLMLELEQRLEVLMLIGIIKAE